jgi:DME family drug/metabolite transporter
VPDARRATPSTSRSALLVALAGVLFGTTGTAQALGPTSTNALSVGAMRIVVGGTLMAVFGLVRYVRRAGWTMPPRTRALLWVVVGAAGLLLFQVTFFAGTRANGVAVGTVVALGAGPLFAGVFEALLFRRPPSPRWLAATALAVAGIVAVSGVLGSGPLRLDPWGLFASLTAGAGYAGYAVSTRVLLQRGWDPVDTLASILAVGVLLGGLILSRTDNAWVADPGGVAMVAWLAVVTVFCAFQLLVFGLRGLSAATATTVALTEPATATLLGVLVLGEPLGWMQALGLAGLVAGVVVAGTGADRSPAAGGRPPAEARPEPPATD